MAVMHSNHMKDYCIYGMYVSKMRGKGVFYEIATHLILFPNKRFTFYPMVKISVILRRVHIKIFANA